MKKLSIAFTFFFLVLLAASGCGPRNEAIDGKLLPLFLSEDGAWCWFQDPRAVYIKGSFERTYSVWMTRLGELRIGAYDHSTGGIETFTLKKQWDTDDHNTGSILVLPDNRLMVFYARPLLSR